MKEPMFRSIDHITVLVTNIEKTRHFYGTVLGLQEIAAPKEFDFVALWYRLDSGYIHLLQKKKKEAASVRHFGLTVRNAPAARKHFAEHGVETEESVAIAAAERFFVHDPDGNRIEIVQWKRPYYADRDGRFSA